MPPISSASSNNISRTLISCSTLAVAARAGLQGTFADIKLARSLRLRTTMHATTPGLAAALDKADMLGSDLTFVHTVGPEATDEDYRLMAACGGTISTSSATEMMSGHGYPSAQRWLAHGLRPSFSVDNETRMPPDLFAQMRALVLSDHMLETERVRKAGGRPVLIPVRDVLEFATVEGARATGLDKRTGTLTPGKRADVIVVDLDDIDLIPSVDPIATVVLRVNSGNVSAVLIDGEIKNATASWSVSTSRTSASWSTARTGICSGWPGRKASTSGAADDRAMT